MKLTPVKLELLLKCYYTTVTITEARKTPALKEASEEFVANEILYINNGLYLDVTTKGSAWVRGILDTPMPVNKWVMEGRE